MGPFRSIDVRVALLVVAVFGLRLVVAGPDPDLWGRIVYGREAARAGVLVLPVDVFSWTVRGTEWIDHEWGFSWLAWLLYEHGGWPILRLYQIAAFATVAWLAARRALPFMLPPGRLPLLVLPLVSVLAIGFGGPRAQIVTYLGFAWIIECLRRSRDGNPRWAIAGALTMPVWVNVHGGFLAGLGVLGAWTAFEAIRAARFGTWHRAAAGGIALSFCGASSLMNPWGSAFFAPLLEAARMARPFVSEWQPTAPVSLLGAGTLALVALDIAWVRRCGPRFSEIAVVAVTAALGVSHQRHAVFHAIAVGIFVVPDLSARWAMGARPDAPQRRALVWMRRLFSIALGAVAGLLAVALFAPAVERNYPARALDFAQEHAATGNVVTDFDWSQYVIFRGWPRFHVAFDGRYEEVYPPAAVSRFVSWSYGLPGWREIMDDPRVEWALVAANSGRDLRLRSLHGWSEVYRDEQAVWFHRGR